MIPPKKHAYYNTCKTVTYMHVDHVQQRMRSTKEKNHLYRVHIHSERKTMFLLKLFLHCSICWSLIMGPFTLYDTVWDTNDAMPVPLQFDCLHYAVPDNAMNNESASSLVEQTITYCRRPSGEFITSTAMPTFQNTNNHNFTFEQLHLAKVTFEHLLSWSAPIDIIERYQIYLNHNFDGYVPGSLDIFYNCTPPWFGTYCQYTFDVDMSMFMIDIVNITFEEKIKLNRPDKVTNLTCYEHLKCNRGPSPMCLDWREVCDGKVDCFDEGAVDESGCFDLEMNECLNEYEFRCHNGLCIVHDTDQNDSINPDCLDRSDERDMQSITDLCFQDPTFRCEEHSCRPGKRDFVCGDGQCVDELDKCRNGRNVLFKELLVTWSVPLLTECRILMSCLTQMTNFIDGELCKFWYKEFSNSAKVIKNYCPSEFPFPLTPVAFEHVRFIYKNSVTNLNNVRVLMPNYICYDQRRCNFRPSIHVLNLTCQYSYELGFNSNNYYSEWALFLTEIKQHFRSCLSVLASNETEHAAQLHSNSVLYRCVNSTKFISKHRLVDGYRDCPENDDELFPASCSLNHTYRIQCSKVNTCLSPVLNRENCPMFHPSEDPTKLSFTEICDGFVHSLPLSINGTLVTDESGCAEHWPCDNMYTRCDGFWTCLNGLDEANCSYSTCPAFKHECVSPVDNNMICLPIDQTNDRIVDCLGGTDERALCRDNHPLMTHPFHCMESHLCVRSLDLCDGRNDCKGNNNDDEFCHSRILNGSICADQWAAYRSNEENFLCNIENISSLSNRYFKLQSSIIDPPAAIHPARKAIATDSTRRPADPNWSWRCNRGLYVRHLLDGVNFSYKCLCPPSYYGDQCQYQSQRVSLTISLLSADERTAYIFVVMLITNDNDRQEIHSYEQIVYTPQNDCRVKFNINLLYASRPKNMSNNYSVRIDAFDRTVHSLQYFASWLLPIPFRFLPVNRLVTQLIIPTHNSQQINNCSLQCSTHGKCMKYVNREQFFCLCHRNWFGAKCHLPINCNHCSSHSSCIGFSGRRSLCVCPMNKFGPRCHLPSSACLPGTCKNQGTCVAASDYMHKVPFQCICTEQFFGPVCEARKIQVDISFANIQIPSHMFTHFITVYTDAHPKLTTRIHNTIFRQHTVTLYRTQPFHLLFVEWNYVYYLVYLHQNDEKPLHISATIHSNQQCPSIQELFNLTTMNLHHLQRIKYYHLICQQNQNLECFFGETLMCLCTIARHANCFTFEQKTSFVCHRYNPCEHDAQCFHDTLSCPSRRICVCRGCYYGNRCQFYVERFGLSLEAILSYAIRRQTPLTEQPISIKICAVITMLMFAFSIVNGFLLTLTFCNKQLREVGCGTYLLASSIISIITMTGFAANFWLLIAVHTDMLTNLSLLFARCVIFEPLLKALLTMHDWMNSCIALERAFTVYQGTKFNHRQSKKVAKWLLGFLIFFSIGTSVHESFNRRLFNDEEEHRIWCIVSYSQSLQKFSSIILLVHFMVPFSINLGSAIFIIISKARQVSTARKSFTYKQHVQEHFRQHKHLIISPIVLVLLGVPKLMISVIPGCMKLAYDPWLLLTSYFISFVPSMLIFVVYVLPSQIYKKEFYRSIDRLRQRIPCV